MTTARTGKGIKALKALKGIRAAGMISFPARKGIKALKALKALKGIKAAGYPAGDPLPRPGGGQAARSDPAVSTGWRGHGSSHRLGARPDGNRPAPIAF
jgi:hypothetical protein